MLEHHNSTNGDSDNDNNDKNKTPPKSKKAKYYNIYKEEWETIYKWSKRGQNDEFAKCIICSKEFSVKNQGLNCRLNNINLRNNTRHILLLQETIILLLHTARAKI